MDKVQIRSTTSSTARFPHWSATEAIASGQDVRTVANGLGHADPAMTLRVYAHAFGAADEALAEILGRCPWRLN